VRCRLSANLNRNRPEQRFRDWLMPRDARPRNGRGRIGVLAAKATILSGLVLAASAIAVLASLIAGRLIFPSTGFTHAHGYPLLSLAHTPTLRATVGSVLYLALIALLSVGVATAVRESATAIGVVLGLLYIFPILVAVGGNPSWDRHVEELGPMTAGLAIQATTNLRSLPISPWAGLGVLAAWASEHSSPAGWCSGCATRKGHPKRGRTSHCTESKRLLRAVAYIAAMDETQASERIPLQGDRSSSHFRNAALD
jgi:hypothetical protein